MGLSSAAVSCNADCERDSEKKYPCTEIVQQLSWAINTLNKLAISCKQFANSEVWIILLGVLIVNDELGMTPTDSKHLMSS